MVYGYFQNSVRLLANVLKKCITTWPKLWNLEKPFVPFVTSKTQTERFVGKWQTDNFGALFVEDKDWTKAEIG